MRSLKFPNGTAKSGGIWKKHLRGPCNNKQLQQHKQRLWLITAACFPPCKAVLIISVLHFQLNPLNEDIRNHKLAGRVGLLRLCFRPKCNGCCSSLSSASLEMLTIQTVCTAKQADVINVSELFTSRLCVLQQMAWWKRLILLRRLPQRRCPWSRSSVLMGLLLLLQPPPCKMHTQDNICAGMLRPGGARLLHLYKLR